MIIFTPKGGILMKRVMLLSGVIFLLFLSCAKKQTGETTAQQLDPAKLLKQADQYYAEGNLDEAFRAYGLIYERFPTSREYIDAVIGLSRCYSDYGNYEKSFDLLYNLVRENMVPSRVPEIYIEMGRYFEVNAGISSVAGLANEEQDYEKAIEYYQKAINYPNSNDLNAKAYAQLRIGELYLQMGKFKDAILAFKATTTSFPGTEWAKIAEERLIEFKEALDKVLGEEEPTESAPADTTKQMTPATPPTSPDSSQLTPPKTAEPPSKTEKPDSSIAPPDTSKPELQFK